MANIVKTGDGEKTDILADLLWENKSPSGPFSSQTVTLSSKLLDYSGVYIEYFNNVGGNSKRNGYYISRSGNTNGTKMFLSYAGTDWNIGRREVKPNFDSNTVWFSDYNYNNGYACVPTRIFGFNF